MGLNSRGAVSHLHRSDVSRAVQVGVKDKDWLRDQLRRKNVDNLLASLDETLARRGQEIFVINSQGRRVRTQVYSAPKGREVLRQEPLKIVRKDDLLLTAGMVHFAKLGTGDSALTWRYMAAGTGTNAENAGDTALQTEVVRIDLDSVGSRFPSGVDMKFAGFFDETVASGTFSEFGVGNAAASGDFLTRTVLPSSPVDERIVHVQNDDVFAFTQIVTQAGS